MHNCNFDENGAKVTYRGAYKLPNGDETFKVKFDNDFVIIYTKAETVLKDIECSHKLCKDSNGVYHADLTHVNQDFYDYFPK